MNAIVDISIIVDAVPSTASVDTADPLLLAALLFKVLLIIFSSASVLFIAPPRPPLAQFDRKVDLKTFRTVELPESFLPSTNTAPPLSPLATLKSTFILSSVRLEVAPTYIPPPLLFAYPPAIPNKLKLTVTDRVALPLSGPT